MTVLFHEDVQRYLEELVDTLYEEEYFGFKESAYDYVDWIIEETESSINTRMKKPAPQYFDKFATGLSYIRIRRNNYTTWYVFFKQIGDVCYVHYIGNNHSCGQYL